MKVLVFVRAALVVAILAFSVPVYAGDNTPTLDWNPPAAEQPAPPPALKPQLIINEKHVRSDVYLHQTVVKEQPIIIYRQACQKAERIHHRARNLRRRVAACLAAPRSNRTDRDLTAMRSEFRQLIAEDKELNKRVGLIIAQNSILFSSFSRKLNGIDDDLKGIQGTLLLSAGGYQLVATNPAPVPAPVVPTPPKAAPKPPDPGKWNPIIVVEAVILTALICAAFWALSRRN